MSASSALISLVHRMLKILGIFKYLAGLKPHLTRTDSKDVTFIQRSIFSVKSALSN